MGGASAPSAPRGSSLGKVSLEESPLKRTETNSKPAWPLSSRVTLEPPLVVTGPSLCNLRAVVRLAGEPGEWGMCNSGCSCGALPTWSPRARAALCPPHSWAEHRLPAGVGTALELGGVLGLGQGSVRSLRGPFSAAEDTQVCSFTVIHSTSTPHWHNIPISLETCSGDISLRHRHRDWLREF